MRIILDTNIILSGLMIVPSVPAQILDAWWSQRFLLLSCEEQIEEIRLVSRRPKMAPRFLPGSVGGFVNEMRSSAVIVEALPDVDASPDPWDNYLLALALKGRADLVVTGDKGDLLALGKFASARIVTARRFLEML